MSLAALERLVDGARALPGGGAGAGLPRAVAARNHPAAESPIEPAALRAGVGALLAELGARLDEALPRVLSLALSAWDQVDSLRVIDPALAGELRGLRRAASALEADEDPSLRASGIEAALMLDATAGLVALLERRLATLVRLKLRSSTPALLDGAGRPFLDVAAALTEAARAWL